MSYVHKMCSFYIVCNMRDNNIKEIHTCLSGEANVAVLVLHLHKHPGFAAFLCSCVHIQITV